MTADQILARVRAAAAGSDLLRAVASVRSDGGLRLALGGVAVRPLSEGEVAWLEGQGNTAEDWSRVRVAEGFHPGRVRNCEFRGDVVLGRFVGMVPVRPGTELPAGVYHATVADSVIGHGALVRDVRLLAGYVVGPGAVVWDCGRVSAEPDTTFGNGAALPVGVETGGREVHAFAELDVELAAAVVRPGRRVGLRPRYAAAVPADAFLDLDGDALSYRATLADGSALPAWLTFDPATATFRGNPEAGDTSPLQVRVTASDGNGGSASEDFRLTLIDVTDSPPTITSNQAAVTVNEGSPATNSGTFDDAQGRDNATLTASLGTVTRNDADGTWSWSYTPADGPDASTEVTITATATSGLTATTTFTLSVQDVAPTIAIGGAGSVNEGVPYTLTLGAVTDPGSDAVSQYVVHWGDGSSDTYTSAGDKTHVYADGGRTYVITVDLIDEDGTHSNRANAIGSGVTVNNVAPTITTFTAPAGGAEGGALALSAAATDPAGAADPLQFAWTITRPDGSTFTLTGALASFTPADDGSYGVNLTVSDGAGGTATQSASLSVANVAPAIALSGAAGVNEGAPYTVTLGAVTDPGSDTVSEYVVHWGDGSSDTYTTPGDKTHVYAGGGTRAITVDLTDEDGSHSDVANPLSVAVNAAPTDLALSNARVAENQPPGTAVGAFSTTDLESGTFTYSLVSGDGDADNAAFSLVDGVLLTAPVLDFEAQSSYAVRVQSTDAGGLSTEKVFLISVIDVNEAPTDITLSSGSVAENQPAGTPVGTLSTTDPDSGGTFTYTLVSGDGDADNAAFRLVDGVLLTAPVLDFEAQSSYAVRVQSTDAGGLSTEKVLTVGVLDVNDPPVLGGAQPGQRVKDNRTIRPFASMTVADEDSPAQGLTVTVQQSRPGHGRFSRASLRDSGFSRVGRGRLSFQGTAAEAEAALRGLVFNPTDNLVCAGAKVSTTFAVEVSDGLATVRDDGTSVVATSVNDRPAGLSHTYSLSGDRALYVPAWQGVLAGASDAEGSPVQAMLVSGPAVGQLQLAPDGSFLYMPPPGIARTVTFRYRVSDGHGSYSDPLTATLEVQAPALPIIIR